MRCFLAIELDDLVRDRLSKVIDDWSQHKASVKWVERDNLHLTIKFLGQFPDERVDDLSQRLQEVCRSVQPFVFNVEGTGVFPDWKRPRVIWIGVRDGELLKQVHKKVEGVTSRLGVEREERPFHPHITVGRVRTHQEIKPLMDAVKSLKDEPFGSVRADHLTFFESRLTSQGPIYRVISRFAFGGESG
ncbi:MAG: RNA 2',3'-cyclic phosphodiesterase [Armatimonadetes bacterium]|nr:RNA 2',3'-cyclic phosphodiesterase [Armatimonadota bacterium]MDW8121567.1 RNA 2',3'-cyclic phosphodiesterase [Armatimonadota bacterium]